MPRDGRELSRREFLAIAGAAASLPLVDRIDPVARQPKRIRIRSVGLDFEREPLIRPTGFKGGYLTSCGSPSRASTATPGGATSASGRRACCGATRECWRHTPRAPATR